MDTAEEAADLAGEDGIPLPVLSRLVGPDSRLTLSPSHHSVIWAIEEAPGEWAVSEVDANAVIARMPQAVLFAEAHDEVKLLTRCALPTAPDAAIEHIQQLLPQLQKRILLLREVWRDLYEQDDLLPHARIPASQ
ncbi:hypothetical protein [Streptomyces sp. NPDC018045]|uniref:hypothetical protein n=1 Tax=Streptomyces sp. NPDC018045 TaxID=3365037 RepID=UPI0037A952B3